MKKKTKYVLSACFICLFFAQNVPLVGVAQSDVGVINGVVQDPTEPAEESDSEPELIVLSEDDYLKYFKTCIEAVEDGESIPDYDTVQVVVSDNLTSWLFDDGIVNAAGGSSSGGSSGNSSGRFDATPYIDIYDNAVSVVSSAIEATGNKVKELLQYFVSTGNATSVTIPNYYTFCGKTIIQYPSTLRETVILSVSFRYLQGNIDATMLNYKFYRVFNGVATMYEGYAYRNMYYTPQHYTKTVNANVPQLTSVGYCIYPPETSNVGYVHDDSGDFTFLTRCNWFFAGTGVFSAYLNTTTYDTLTNRQVAELPTYVNSGLPVYTITAMDTNDYSTYIQTANDKVEYKQWDYSTTYNNTFVAGDTINTTNVSNYNDYGLTVVNGYLDFDADAFLDHLANLQSQVDLNYQQVYNALPDEGATYEQYEGTYYYPYATESPSGAGSSGGGDVNVDVRVTLDYETFDKISTEHYIIDESGLLDNIHSFDLTQIPSSTVKGVNGIFALFSSLYDKTGLLPYFLALLGASLIIGFLM